MRLSLGGFGKDKSSPRRLLYAHHDHRSAVFRLFCSNSVVQPHRRGLNSTLLHGQPLIHRGDHGRPLGQCVSAVGLVGRQLYAWPLGLPGLAIINTADG